jgi:16S rRNA processing protein RimM
VRLVVGRVGRAHGVRGEVAVEVRTDAPEIRFAPGSVLATDPETVGPLTVAQVRRHSGRLLVTFAGVGDRSAAETLRGTLLLADAAAVPPLDDPDEFWDHELLGLAAVDRTGSPLGEVTDVLHPAGHDLLVVRRPDGGELLVPFVSEIVPEVDLARRTLVVDPPPGLLDLPAARPRPPR